MKAYLIMTIGIERAKKVCQSVKHMGEIVTLNQSHIQNEIMLSSLNVFDHNKINLNKKVFIYE